MNTRAPQENSVPPGTEAVDDDPHAESADPSIDAPALPRRGADGGIAAPAARISAATRPGEGTHAAGMADGVSSQSDFSWPCRRPLRQSLPMPKKDWRGRH